MQRKRFTREEDKVIIKEIRLSPTNLQAAFLKAAFRLNRTKASVECHYYKTLRKRTNHILLLFAPRRLASNRKNTFRNRIYPKNTVLTIKDKWKTILNILFD